MTIFFNLIAKISISDSLTSRKKNNYFIRKFEKMDPF